VAKRAEPGATGFKFELRNQAKEAFPLLAARTDERVGELADPMRTADKLLRALPLSGVGDG
jgi:hypothetical protein